MPMVTKPMLLDETGKQIVQQLETIAGKIGTSSGSSGTGGSDAGTTNLTIGTVTSGDTASASIKNGKLNLVLPRGEKGRRVQPEPLAQRERLERLAQKAIRETKVILGRPARKGIKATKATKEKQVRRDRLETQEPQLPRRPIRRADWDA